jgi:Family of unknown function (DUF6326)
MNTNAGYRDPWINPRLKLAALWASMLFIFAFIDLFSLHRADVRADIEAGEVGGFKIDQTFLLLVTIYTLIPSLLLSLTVLLPVRVTRVANIIVAAVYVPTVVGSAVGELSYFILASAIETALLLGVIYHAWIWPRAEAEEATTAQAQAISPAR